MAKLSDCQQLAAHIMASIRHYFRLAVDCTDLTIQYVQYHCHISDLKKKRRRTLTISFLACKRQCSGWTNASDCVSSWRCFSTIITWTLVALISGYLEFRVNVAVASVRGAKSLSSTCAWLDGSLVPTSPLPETRNAGLIP